MLVEDTVADPLLSLPLYQVPFAVLDVETTGLHPELGDAICEIAILRVCDGRVQEEYQRLVDPGRPLSPEAYAVNRISSDLLRGAPPFAEIVGEVLPRLEGAAIVAHNAPFDLGFLVAALEELDEPIPANPIVDTLALARTCYGFPKNNLHAIAQDLGISVLLRHRALGDVWTTWRILEFFSQDLQSRWGLGTLGELIHAQGGPISWPCSLPREALPDVLAEALARRRPIFLRYCSSEGDVSERTVEPLRVGAYQGALYLVARCTLRGEQRTFRLDRILEMHLPDLP
jgi:DNA polymerase III epsilon subunit family exonuclease